MLILNTAEVAKSPVLAWAMSLFKLSKKLKRGILVKLLGFCNIEIGTICLVRREKEGSKFIVKFSSRTLSLLIVLINYSIIGIKNYLKSVLVKINARQETKRKMPQEPSWHRSFFLNWPINGISFSNKHSKSLICDSLALALFEPLDITHFLFCLSYFLLEFVLFQYG